MPRLVKKDPHALEAGAAAAVGTPAGSGKPAAVERLVDRTTA